MSTYNYTPGLGNAASYQVSGKPYATASISPIDGVVEISFPAVTGWVLVKNAGASAVSVGFSSGGITESNNFITVDAANAGAGTGSLGPLDLKLTRLYLSGSRNDTKSIHVVAGLTGIPLGQLDTVSGSVVQLGGAGIQGPNWSGSAGVG
jgi:hypothetical protein